MKLASRSAVYLRTDRDRGLVGHVVHPAVPLRRNVGSIALNHKVVVVLVMYPSIPRSIVVITFVVVVGLWFTNKTLYG